MTMARESAAEREAREAQEQADAAVAAAAAGSDVAPTDGKVKVKVDQPDGEIVLTRGGEVVLSKTVKDGQVTADDDTELAVLLGSIPGAQQVD